MNSKILVIEDDDRIREITCDYFRANNFIVTEATNGNEALEKFNSDDFSLIILDIMMPELDGWTVCRKIRQTSYVPIIMLTARESEDDKLLGFELGADEYVTKPFSPKVLVARAKTLLKRANTSLTEDLVNVNGIEIDRRAYTVKIDNTLLDLSPKEYSLLLLMVDNPGIVLTRESILNSVWGYDYFGDSRVVDTHIKKLRKKLASKSDFIKTVIRVGYKFEVNQ